MKIKIISDGTHQGTKVIDLETGEAIHGVIAVEWEHDMYGMPQVKLTVAEVAVEIVGKLVRVGE